MRFKIYNRTQRESNIFLFPPMLNSVQQAVKARVTRKPFLLSSLQSPLQSLFRPTQRRLTRSRVKMRRRLDRGSQEIQALVRPPSR